MARRRVSPASVLNAEKERWQEILGVPLKGPGDLWTPEEDDLLLEGHFSDWTPQDHHPFRCFFRELRRSSRSMKTRLWVLSSRYGCLEPYAPGPLRAPRFGLPFDDRDMQLIEFATGPVGVGNGAHTPASIAPLLCRKAAEVRRWLSERASAPPPLPYARQRSERLLRPDDLPSRAIDNTDDTAVAEAVYRQIAKKFRHVTMTRHQAVNRALRACIHE